MANSPPGIHTMSLAGARRGGAVVMAHTSAKPFGGGDGRRHRLTSASLQRPTCASIRCFWRRTAGVNVALGLVRVATGRRHDEPPRYAATRSPSSSPPVGTGRSTIHGARGGIGSLTRGEADASEREVSVVVVAGLIATAVGIRFLRRDGRIRLLRYRDGGETDASVESRTRPSEAVRTGSARV